MHEIIFAENANLDGVGESVARLLEDWETFANLQGTPGYLLLASGYLQLAKIALDTEHTEQHHAAYYSAWKYLHLAKLSEPYCAAAINNAWFGKGMGLANPFQFNSIDEMILCCSSVAKNSLTESDKYSAESEAKRLFATLTHSFRSPCWFLSLATEVEENNELDLDNQSLLPQLL